MVVSAPVHLRAASVLWYNGDPIGFGDLSNQAGGSFGPGNFSAVYDQFNVTGLGWDVTGVFSNDDVGMSASIPTGTTAYWAIVSGLSPGVSGTVIASGTNVVTITATTFNGAFPIYLYSVSGLNIQLTPGTYWLTVSPTDTPSTSSWIEATSGSNAIGTPAGNDGQAIFNSNEFGKVYVPAVSVAQGGDFSMGVLGTNLNPAP